MPRQPLAHVDAGRSGRITSIEIARARLLDVDVDRGKRIDAAIDYFGAGYIRFARDPCGESLLDETGRPHAGAVPDDVK